MGTKPHLFLSKVDNLITWQETHSLSRIPREDCHETCSSAERGGEQSQLIPKIIFREDFPVGMSASSGDDGSTGIVITNRRQRWAPLGKAVLIPKDVEHQKGKADVNERERGTGKGRDVSGPCSRSEVAGGAELQLSVPSLLSALTDLS